MADLPLVELCNISKITGSLWKRKTVLKNVTLRVARGENHAVLALRDMGVPSANSLLAIIAGIGRPSIGKTVRRGRICAPPVAMMQIAPFKTVHQIAFFLARLYDAEPSEILGYTAEFAGLSASVINTKLGTLSVEERVKVGIAVSFALPAEMYCFENGIAWGDDNFKARCKSAFNERRKRAATIVTTDNVTEVLSLADTGSVLHKKELYTFDSISEAIALFNKLKLSHEETSLTHLRTLIRMGEMQWMSEYLDQVSPTGAGSAEKYTILAELALQSRRYDEAVRAAELALDNGASQSRLTLVIARAREGLGDYVEAVRQLESIGESNQDASIKILLARNLERLNELGKAGIVWMHVAIEHQNAQARQRAEACFIKTKDWLQLLSLTEHTLSVTPRNLAALELRFKALMNLRSWPETVPVVRATAEINLVKAIAMIYQALQTEDWPAAVSLVKCLPRERLEEVRDERMLVLVVTFLKRRGVLAHKAGDTTRGNAADEAIELLNRFVGSKTSEHQAKKNVEAI